MVILMSVIFWAMEYLKEYQKEYLKEKGYGHQFFKI